MGVIPQKPPRPLAKDEDFYVPEGSLRGVGDMRPRMATTCSFCDLSQLYAKGRCVDCGAALPLAESGEVEIIGPDKPL